MIDPVIVCRFSLKLLLLIFSMIKENMHFIHCTPVRLNVKSTPFFVSIENKLHKQRNV